jgi:hypothetical protein
MASTGPARRRRVVFVAMLLGSWLAGVVFAADPEIDVDLDEDGATIELDFDDSMSTWPNRIEPGQVSIDGVEPLDCAWYSDTAMECELHGPSMRHATRYTLRIAPGLATLAGTPFAARALPVETDRPAARLWIQAWEAGIPELRVKPDQRITMDNLVAVLRLSLDGQSLPVQLDRIADKDDEDEDDTPEYRVRLPAPARPGLLELQLLPGLTGEEGPLPSVKEAKLRARVLEPQALRSVECSGPKELQRVDPAKTKRLQLACVPDEGFALIFARAIPDADIERWRAGLGADWTFEKAEAQAWYPWSQSGDATRTAPGFVIRLEPRVPQARLTLPLAGLLPGAPAIAVETTAVRPHFRTLGRNVLLADADAELATTLGAGAVPVDVYGLGQAVQRETLALSDPGVVPVAVESAATRRILGEGGWARWNDTAPTAERRRLVVDFAAPEFDLLTVAGRTEVIAWANAWDHDAPVVGAELELLRLAANADAPQVLARATTDADGIARLRLPHRWQAPEDQGAMWFVRGASAEHGRALLPVQAQRWNALLGNASESRLWGVADRPLYRAGDTVRYRLWLRDEIDGRLMRAAPRKDYPLALRGGEDDQHIRRWTAPVDERGNMTGEILLPEHLPDGSYCIQTQDDSSGDGTCFYVGTYEAQDLWTELEVDRKQVRAGDLLGVETRAGYYSGGEATGAKVKFETLLLPVAVGTVYPEFAAYAFAGEGEPHDELIWRDPERAPLQADASGRAGGRWPVRFEQRDEDAPPLPVLGRLRIVAKVALEGRSDVATPAATVTYIGAEKFVGLRTTEPWLRAGKPVRLDAVVVTAEGKAIAQAPIEVVVSFRPEQKRGEDHPADVPLATCRLMARVVTTCDFPRERDGRYVFAARSAGATPVELTRWFWRTGEQAAEPEAELEPEPGDVRPGAVASLRLRQPYATARVLLVAHSTDTSTVRVERVSAAMSQLHVATAPHWRGFVHALAYVRSPEPSRIDAGARLPTPVLADDLHFALQDPLEDAREPLSLRFEATPTRPGATARIHLRNDSDAPRDVVVAVVDDALRTLAADWLAYFDPENGIWLGASDTGQQWNLDSFGQWHSKSPLQIPLKWRESEGRAAPRVLSQTVTRSRRVLAESAAASPAAAPDAYEPEEFRYSGSSDGTELDSIVVTGTRIRRDPELEGPGHDRALRLPQSARGPRQARVRSDFRDVALWQTGMLLQPGESRTLELVLPDNLTRWRAVAWSSDADDGFAMTEATLTSGLPIEVRVQAPVRVYPGDHAQVGAHVHRLGGAARPVDASIVAEGAGVAADVAQALAPAAGGQATLALALAPEVPGSIALTTSASTSAPGERDALGGLVEVAPAEAVVRLSQVGWLSQDALQLPLPERPSDAGPAQLRVSLLRGDTALVSRWTAAMRDYPHRCWEQILSRAVAAAQVLDRGEAAAWPDATDAVREAQDNAAVFQGNDGGFRYFVMTPTFPDLAYYRDDDHVGLTAYSLHAMGWLRALGQPLPERAESEARRNLLVVVNRHEDVLLEAEDPDADAADDADAEELAEARAEADMVREEIALALGAIVDGKALPGSKLELAPMLDALWTLWDRQSRPARLATTRALLRSGHRAAPRALSRLLDEAPARGGVRRLGTESGQDARWMGSALRDQCELIELLDGNDSSAIKRARRELLAGLTDLHAGGAPAIDTQSAAYCLMALRGDADAVSGAVRMSASVAERSGEIAMAAGENEGEWKTTAPERGTLALATDAGPDARHSYAVELEYTEDARTAQATALGMRLSRGYAVLRGTEWVALDASGVAEGEWVRVTLTVDVPAPRYFVAVTDAVPGGLQPADLRLGGVAGLRLQSLANPGSTHFDARRLDSRSPRFYAEQLPAGKHVIHYFARAAHPGDYLAAPAVAEIMYGEGARARTAAERVKVGAPSP